MRMRTAGVLFSAGLTLLIAQAPPRAGGLGGQTKGGAKADPQQLERGRGLYSVQCTFCHGGDARGGESGPNLLRSQIVLGDSQGELIAPVVQEGRPEQGMPPIPLTKAQIVDIAAFIQSLVTTGRDVVRNPPPSIVTGNAPSGQRHFAALCSSCHSVAGDLKGIASRVTDARTLQQTWLMPGGGGFGAAPVVSKVGPKTVTVTTAPGQKLEGTLVRIDDFLVTISLADGSTRTIRRHGDQPPVEVHDPLKPHKDLLAVYTDSVIHDITAYLVTLK